MEGIGCTVAVAEKITCKDCGQVFVIGPKEITWYVDKMGYPLPKRCKECRKRRREQNAKRNRRERNDGVRAKNL